MKNKKGLMYYIRYYLILLSAYVVLVLISTAMNDWEFNNGQLISIAYLPLTFVLFLFLFDRLIDKVIKPKNKEVEDKYTLFVKGVVEKIDQREKFLIEDYNQLRENDKFQKALKHAFDIVQNGETEEMNVNFLRKKFKKDTIEDKAMKVVLEEVLANINS